MGIRQRIIQWAKTFLKAEYDVDVNAIELQPTRKEFDGDTTLVVFPLLKYIKTNPEKLGQQIGGFLKEKITGIEDFNVIKGFLNIVLNDALYLEFFNTIKERADYGFKSPSDETETILVEYSSPNTNKPLHLGHIRNNVLGYSLAKILKATGRHVYKTQIINDRGIHICKSMVAWKKFAQIDKNGKRATPASTGIKGDKFVGDFYVKFDEAYKKEVADLVEEGIGEKEAKRRAPLMQEAQEALKNWEEGDKETVALWETMNSWVYDGFEKTYKNLGVDFDKNYYESQTYLLGKDSIEEGLRNNVFYKKEDGSVWIDLSDEGLDEKLVLRADGTAVYITQDIGTAIQRVNDFNLDGMVYTVGNEQEYHFKVLFLILKKLGYDWADNLYHLSYGMVDLPSGKMKSREGTVVDADELMAEMTATARDITAELGKLGDFSEQEKEELYDMIGLAALKYFILKVDPRKGMLFDPEKSVDFQGNTGPFIQYTYARIQSILRKVDFDCSTAVTDYNLHQKEKALLKQLEQFPEVVESSANQHSPALIANYTYDLVKDFNSFYQNVPILGIEDQNAKIFRVQLSETVARTVKNAFRLLGIEVPRQM